MFCGNCQQDVPELPVADGEVVHCAYCGSPLDAGSREESSPPVEMGENDAASLLDESLVDLTAEIQQANEALRNAPASLDEDPLLDWRFEEDLLQAEWLLGHTAGDAQTRDSKVSEEPPALLSSAPGTVAAAHPSAAPVRRRPSLLAWSALLLGLAGFICGVILLGWSYVANRPELWNLGLPITLAGQVGLLIGVTLQLDRLWHDSRRSADQLAQLDHQLHDIQTTTRLSAPYQTASQSFYSHMVDGAGPHVLLNDLKSQLDLLAVKLSEKTPR